MSKVDSLSNTWPVRLKKIQVPLVITPKSYETFFKSHIMSLDVIPDLSDSGNYILSSFESKGLISENDKKLNENGNSIIMSQTLDSLLESLPLVYNPTTKQLQVVKLKSKGNDSSEIKGKKCYENELCSHRAVNQSEEVCELIPKSDTDDEILCNLVSQKSFPSRSNSFKTTSYFKINQSKSKESSVTGSFENVNTLNTKSLSTPVIPVNVKHTIGFGKPFSKDTVSSSKKSKGISGLFTRNLFPWRSKLEDKVSNPVDCDTESVSSDVSSFEDGSTSWRLFSKGEPAVSHSVDIITHEAPAGSSGLIMEERPENLPAKTPFEQEKHKQEYKDIVTAAKKKELKEAKERRKAQALQLKQEKCLSDSVHSWNTLIIPKWDTMRNHKKCQELWWAGLPSCVRGKVWKLAIGNKLKITPELYSEYVQRSLDKLSVLHFRSIENDSMESSGQSKNQESTLNLIQMDVSRTFPHLCIFQKGGPFHDPLHNILGAYVCYRPDVGYVQGMSFLAATFLLNMEESDAFIYFANLINRPLHMAFFTVDQRVMQAYYSTFEEVLQETLPQLADHLQKLNVFPNMYFLDWVLTIFSRSCPLDVAARLWDVYLRDGEKFLFRASLGILKHFERDLTAEDCTAHAAQFLTRLPDDLNADSLFRVIASVPVTLSSKKTFTDVLDEHLGKLINCV